MTRVQVEGSLVSAHNYIDALERLYGPEEGTNDSTE